MSKKNIQEFNFTGATPESPALIIEVQYYQKSGKYKIHIQDSHLHHKPHYVGFLAKSDKRNRNNYFIYYIPKRLSSQLTLTSAIESVVCEVADSLGYSTREHQVEIDNKYWKFRYV